MLKWLKDSAVKMLLAEVQRNAKRYDVIIEMLRAQAGVAADLELVKEELSTVHGLIFELTGKVEQMATKDDVTKLETALKGVQDAAELIAQDTAALKEELKTANENSNADLTTAISMAEGIESRLKGIAGPNIGSDPEPAPEPPTAPEG